MSKRTLAIVSIAVLLAMLFAACGGPTPSREEPTAAPTATPQEEEIEKPASIEGESLLQERCTTCHDLNRATRGPKTRKEWERTVVRMVGKGVQLNADEQATLIEYLAETYGP